MPSIRNVYGLAVTVVVLAAMSAWSGELPRCEVRSGVEGAPAIVVDGRPISPIMFCGNNQFGRDDLI